MVVEAAAAVPGSFAVIAEMEAKFPAVKKELARIRPSPAQKKTAAIRPSPTAEMTLAVAGAAMDRPGIHYIRFPSLEMDLRPELVRMAIDTMLLNQNVHVVVLTSRQRSVGYAIGDLLAEGTLKESDKETVHLVRGQEDFREQVERLVHNNVLFVVDLDSLAQDFPYREIRALGRARKLNTVLLFGNRSHPCLRDFFYDNERGLAWGVNGAQVMAIDGPSSERALAAVEAISGGGFKARELPEKIRDLQTSQLVTTPYSSSDKIRRQVWTSIAGAFSLRDARRRGQQVRVLEFVPEDPYPTEGEIRKLLTTTSRHFDSHGPVAMAVAAALDNAWVCLEQLHRISVPLRDYRESALKHSTWGVMTPFDRLAQIDSGLASASSSDRLLTGDLVKAATMLRSLYDHTMETAAETQLPLRTRILFGHLRKDLADNKLPGVVCYDEADRKALGEYIRREFVEAGTGKTGHVRRLLSAKLTAEEGLDVAYLLQPPSEKTLDRLARSGVPRVVLIVPRSAAVTHGLRLFRDVILEERVFCFDQQQQVLRALQVKTPLTADWNVVSAMGSEMKAKLEEAKAIEKQLAPSEQEVNWRLVVEDIVHGSIESTGPSKPRATSKIRLDNYIVVHFTDGSNQAVLRDSLVQVLDASTKNEPREAHRLQKGDVVVVANNDLSSSSFGRTIVDLVSELDPKLQAFNIHDENWRTGLMEMKKTRRWEDILALAKAFGYRNISYQTFYWYATWMTWRPARDSDFEAILDMLANHLSPDFGKLKTKTMDATSRLRKFAMDILGYIKRQARTSNSFAELATASKSENNEPDPLIIPDLGLRASHLDSIIQVKEIQRVEAST